MTEAGVENSSLSVALDPSDRVVVVLALEGYTPLVEGGRLREIDAQKHVYFVPRVVGALRPGIGHSVIFVGKLDRLPFEGGGDRTRRIVNFYRRRLSSVCSLRRAEHFHELGPERKAPACRVDSTQAAA